MRNTRRSEKQAIVQVNALR